MICGMRTHLSNAAAFAIAVLGGLCLTAVLLLLHLRNPQDVSWFPRCPFFTLTGYKCPGCGTMRAIHALLHLRVFDAVRLNPFMVSSIPIMLAMVLSRRFRYNVLIGKIVLVSTMVWWVLRNVNL